MHTITIEIERQGDSHDHKLSSGNVYLASCENEPVVNISINCNQTEFELHKEMLRYTKEDPFSVQKGLSFLQPLVTKILDDIRPLAIVGNRREKDWLHIRLIVSAKELIQMPFELALTPNGFRGQYSDPFLVNPQRLTTLTREVKQAGNFNFKWPQKPRILFAWANPGQEVPYDEHFTALRDVAKLLVVPFKDNPEPIPDISALITVLKKASLKALENEIKEGIRTEHEYTHIHLLAHGIKSSSQGIPEEFKLVLHDPKDLSKADYVTGKELALAILQTNGEVTKFPAIVTLMACDTANTGSIALPAGSVAHQLHESGIPCVFASQFPLSVAGSVTLVETLYSKLLLEGEDPRKALYYARKGIADTKIHDWASLVAHVRFPENIDEQLKDYRLDVLFKSLKISNEWTDHVFKFRNEIQPAVFEKVLEDIGNRLNNSIDMLIRLIKQVKNRTEEMDRYAENSGLIASAYKRKAEHLFRMAQLKSELKESFYSESKKAIISARDWYLNGYERHPRHHWTGMQYLSLTAIINGSLNFEEEQENWIDVKKAAKVDDNTEVPAMTQIWAWGTLTELYLLKPLTVQPGQFDEESIQAISMAKEFANKMMKANSKFIADPGINSEDIIYAQETTARQLDRYIYWWPVMLPSEGLNKIKVLASEIRKLF